MQNAQAILFKIHGFLDQLIDIAASLEKLSKEMASEEEINSLQEEQENIIAALMQLDADLIHDYPEVAKEDSKERKAIHQKMEIFQKLNRNFIENLERGSGIIQFD